MNWTRRCIGDRPHHYWPPENGGREQNHAGIDPGGADLAARLERYDAPCIRIVENTLLKDLLSWTLPALIFFGVWFFLFRRFADKQGMGGFLSIGKSRAKIYVQTDTGVTFADVAGVDEARHELEEVVDFLKHPQEYGRLGTLWV